MPFGFMSQTADSKVQIDGNFKNVAYVGRVTILSTAWSNNQASVATPDHDFAFIGDTAGSFVSLIGNQPSGAGRSLTFLTSSPSTIYIYLYARQSPKTGTYGMHVFGAAEDLVFSAADNHLSVLTGINWPASQTGGSITAPAQGQAFTIALPPLPSMAGRLQPQGQQLMMLYLMFRAIRVSNSTRAIDVGSVSRLAGVTDWVSGHGAWSFPPNFTAGTNIIVAGHYGNV